ncbi:DoxX family protein (plasmid) [Erythrobacteraceae bacterium WH01K]|nr:DoxX family protein [Erythrobacteraceae bacterium WH01K]
MAHLIRSTPVPSRWSLRIGWSLSGLAILMLGMDAGAKLIAPEVMIANSPPLGLPADPGFHRILGAILALCTLLYAWPRTSPIGAVLLTGYLGGAVATHLRVDSPLVTHTFVSVYLGAIVWLGLMLRDRRVAALLATSQTADQSLLAEDVFND